MLCRINMFKSL